MSSNETSTQNGSTQQTGRVKWFNNRTGYGFITITKGDHQDLDVFVHHTSIDVATEQYRYLVQGEYVSFTLERTTDENAKHEYQASHVTGLDGGLSMCETRNLNRDTASNSDENDRDQGTDRYSRKKWRGSGRRDRNSTQDQGWTLAKGKGTVRASASQ